MSRLEAVLRRLRDWRQERVDWYVAAASLTEFLEAYLEAEGDMYWERRD